MNFESYQKVFAVENLKLHVKHVLDIKSIDLKTPEHCTGAVDKPRPHKAGTISQPQAYCTELIDWGR